jgi:hypothetical protein
MTIQDHYIKAIDEVTRAKEKVAFLINCEDERLVKAQACLDKAMKNANLIWSMMPAHLRDAYPEPSKI